MQETPAPGNNTDPNHEHLHRVGTVDLQRYKLGVTTNVTALCGKRWEPTLPFESNMRTAPRCSVCFPPENHRFSIAM